jgi:hypothetical protein
MMAHGRTSMAAAVEVIWELRSARATAGGCARATSRGRATIVLGGAGDGRAWPDLSQLNAAVAAAIVSPKSAL